MQIKSLLRTAALSLIMSALSAQAAAYRSIIDLGTLGGNVSNANGINIHGEVVGVSALPGAVLYRAFLYNGVLHDIGTPFNIPGVGNSNASAINSSGVVVGGSYVRDTQFTNAFLFNGHMQNLGTLNEGPQSWATAINNLGEAVGWANPGSYQFGYDEAPVYHAVIFSAGKITDIGTIGSGVSSFAYGVNNLGEIVGYSSYIYPASQWDTNLGPYHAFLYAYGHMYDLGINPVLAPYQSIATAINDHGQVVGYTFTDAANPYQGNPFPTSWNGIHHAFLDSAGSFKDLGALGLYDQSEAFAINNSGEIVGTDQSPITAPDVPLPPAHGFLYRGGVMLDVNSLLPKNSGLVINSCNRINDNGQICGDGQHNGLSRAFLLTP